MGQYRQQLFEVVVRAGVSGILDNGMRSDIRRTVTNHNFVRQYTRGNMELCRIYRTFSHDIIQNGVPI